MPERLGLLWEGSFFVHHSLANVNCEVAALLARRDDVDLGLLPFEPHEFDETADGRHRLIAPLFGRRPGTVHAHVRHRFPPEFTRPERGAFVLVQPWEFPHVPLPWVDAIARTVDELWVHTSFVRDAYARSGVDPAKLALIPLGADPARFRPDAPPAALRTERSYRFLFVGGAIERKGFDVLLRAYAEEFSSADDVCLVVKDFFYGPQSREAVEVVRRRRSSPEIDYRYENVLPSRLPGLYTACDCYVHPYRAEGFGLPILEAMACGLPTIVTGHGAALDFCDDEVSYLVPAGEAEVPRETWAEWLPTAVPPTWAEPDRAALRRLLRHVFEHREEARHKGELARARAHARYTWSHTVAGMMARLGRFLPT